MSDKAESENVPASSAAPTDHADKEVLGHTALITDIHPRNAKERLDEFFRRIPFAFLLGAIVLAASLAVGAFAGPVSQAVTDQWGMSVEAIQAGHWWAPLTGTLIARDPLSAVTAIIGVILMVGAAERIIGTRRAATAFVITGILGSLLGVLLQWIGTLTWEFWATGSSVAITLDPLTGAFGALMAASAAMTPLWRRRTRVIMLTFVLIFVLYSGDAQDLYRVLAAVVGLPLGLLLTRRMRVARPRFSSHRETRTLVGAVLLVTAIGPIVAFVGSTDVTPFAFGSYLFMNDPVDASSIASMCSSQLPLSHKCLHLLSRLGTQGPGMYILSFVPVALLIIAAWGLHRGRRYGWWLAIGVNTAILAFAPSAFISVRFLASGAGRSLRPFDGQELIIWLITAALVPLGSIVLLLITRRHFNIKAEKGAGRKFAIIVGSAFAVLVLVYLTIALTSAWHSPLRANPWWVVADTPRRFLPPHFVIGKAGFVIPPHTPMSWAAQWMGVVFWLTFVVASLMWIVRPARLSQDAHDVQRFRTLLARHGGGTMGHMGTWEGNTPWFTSDGQGALPFRIVNGFAIVLGDPVCAQGQARTVITEFLSYCDANDLDPVFYSIHPQYLPIFTDLGWSHMSVGEETVLHPQDFSMKGKQWQSVRTSLNKATREGMTTVWTSWAELPFAAMNEITSISEAWVAESELPEMGFTLGGVEELHDPDVKIMLALDGDLKIQAVTSWMPVHEEGEIIGWTLDFMRRAPESNNGVMEFLIASSALHMKKEGYRILSLSGAPLATKPLKEGEVKAEETGITAVLSWLARTLEPAYGFSSLFRFKAKFHPEYVTISMAYPDLLLLPGIGVALGRAYLPSVKTREAVGLARALGRKSPSSAEGPRA